MQSPLIFAFEEMWHNETSFFHPSFGGLTTMLDVMSFLFHIPLDIDFFSAPFISITLAAINVEMCMGVTLVGALEDMMKKSTNFNHSWIQEKSVGATFDVKGGTHSLYSTSGWLYYLRT